MKDRSTRAPRVRIRRADPAEAGALSDLARASKGFWGYTEAQLDAWGPALTLSAASIRKHPTYVAELEGELAGFCQVDRSARPVELEHLWVHPTFMRLGVGSALLFHTLRFLARGGVASLLVDADPNAEAFYLSCGAHRQGERPAPIDGQPLRVRPLLSLSTTRRGLADASPAGTQERPQAPVPQRADTPPGSVPCNPISLAPYNSYGRPPFVERGFYVDSPFDCSTCGKAEVWRAAQQKWWYEVAKGNVESRAKLCRACRRAEQDRRAKARRIHLEGVARKRTGVSGA